MFQALGGSNFSIGKAWESLEQLVAPIPEDEENEFQRKDVSSSPAVEDEEDEGFENAIMQHILSKRQEIEKDDARRAPFQHQHDPVPDSPSSMSTITLDEDESPMNSRIVNSHIHDSLPVKNMFTDTPPAAVRSQSTSSVFLSNAELEKNVQSRYREQLENEIQRFEKRIREQKEMFENILLNVQEERDFYMKKVSILEENGRLDAVVENQQQEILELQEMMRDLSSKLHTALEDRAILDEKYKVSSKEIEKLHSHIEELKNTNSSPVNIQENALSNEEQSQYIEQLTLQLTVTKEEIEGLKNTIAILSRENEALVIELSEKDLEITKLQTDTFDTEDLVWQNTVGQNQVQKQLLEESERANDALRSELTALKLEYTTATIAWERAQAALEKEIAALKENSAGTNGHRQEIQHFQEEIRRLETALTESEHILKETEEMTWKHKAEAAELLYAYESDQKKWEQEKKSLEDKESLSQQEIQRLRSELQQIQQSSPSVPIQSPPKEDGQPAVDTACDSHPQEAACQEALCQKDKEIALLQGQLHEWQALITDVTDILHSSIAADSTVSNHNEAIQTVSAKLQDLVVTHNSLASSTLKRFVETLAILVTAVERCERIKQEMAVLTHEDNAVRPVIGQLYQQLQEMASWLSLPSLSLPSSVHNEHDSSRSHNRVLLEKMVQTLSQLRRETEVCHLSILFFTFSVCL